jgi:hypothetical protein
MTTIAEDDGQLCNCFALDCWHEKDKCDEPPQRKYGTCLTCKMYNPRRCKTCGQVVPDDVEEKQ